MPSRSNVPAVRAPVSVGRLIASVMVAGVRSVVVVSGARPKAATTPKSGRLERATRVRRLKRRSAPVMRSVKILSLVSGIDRFPSVIKPGSLPQMTSGDFVQSKQQLVCVGRNGIHVLRPGLNKLDSLQRGI